MRRLLLRGLLIALLMSGCGDKVEAIPDPEPELPVSLCEAVSAEDLAAWSDRSRTLIPPQQVYDSTICGTDLGEDNLGIDWRFTPLDGDLADLADTRSAEGARRQKITLPGRTSALLITHRGKLGPSTVIMFEFDEGAAALVTTSIAADWKPEAGPQRRHRC